MAKVEGVHVSLVDPAHRYGQVTSGKPLIRCLLMCGTLVNTLAYKRRHLLDFEISEVTRESCD